MVFSPLHHENFSVLIFFLKPCFADILKFTSSGRVGENTSTPPSKTFLVGSAQITEVVVYRKVGIQFPPHTQKSVASQLVVGYFRLGVSRR